MTAQELDWQRFHTAAEAVVDAPIGWRAFRTVPVVAPDTREQAIAPVFGPA